MRAVDAIAISGGGVGASAAFQLSGGLYQFAVTSATFGGGNVSVQQLGSDGTTWFRLSTALNAVGANTFNAPMGTYRFFSVTAISIAASVARIPGE